MPAFERDGAVIHYDVQGSGLPLLAVAPGGMRSASELWGNAPFNPRGEFRGDFRVVTMDQRNAGASRGPIAADHGWDTYLDDQIALMDHLGFDRFLYIGMCIGGSYGLGLAQRAPERVLAAVLLQPIGLDENRDAFYQMFDSWRDQIASDHPEMGAAAWAAMRSNMYDRDFVFSLTRQEVARVQTPMLVMRGDDLYHPASTSEEIAEIAPNAELVHDWKEGRARTEAIARIRAFFSAYDAL
ncbi:MAG: alpha/beta hydrolase [Pseudomonadota bacterium]|nr:alpha/beta hydrolase [Pseudomonadota bacterium]